MAKSSKSKSSSNGADASSSCGIAYLLSHPALQILLGVAIVALSLVLLESYQIRLLAIRMYGPVIHEFDPYFNFRATEYLYEHGAKKFFTWFDYMVWYPLGRPVGTTIYPGMQFTAVWIKNYIVGDMMSLNDVCCYIPAWFGVIATILTGMITYEVTLPCNTSDTILGSFALWVKKTKKNDASACSDGKMIPLTCGLCAMAAMAIMPAHLMRSVGGGFDNESVAMSAMLLTFYFWVRSLRVGETYGYLFGILTGVAYFYMAASWGGYVFVLNMIGLHAGVLVLLGRFSDKVYKAYSLFYVVGTILAIQVPVVGLAPLKSLEQLGAFAVFAGFQVLQFCEINIRKQKLKGVKAMQYRINVIFIAAVLGIFLIAVFTPAGYFGPISSRIRGLFVKHTKTGNPLVDSVAEHQPAKANSYFQYLHHFCMLAPIGFMLVMAQFGDSPSFVSAYGLTAYFFSHKMVRLILFLAPAASILGGIALGRGVAWSVMQFWDTQSADQSSQDESKAKDTKKKKPIKKDTKQKETPSDAERSKVFIKKTTAVVVLVVALKIWSGFHKYCWEISKHLSNPTIIQLGQTRSGEHVKVDDYREAYWWIRDNTPQDARIMSWWDYGYQLTAIANRTTIADGNTWNHEHIALLARILTGPLDEGYEIARHMADYMLVWSGGGGDDVAKSPHLARIANSVYRNMCPDDPVCSKFGFVPAPGGRGRAPSSQMKKSLVYQLVTSGLRQDLKVDPNKFKEVYRTKYGKVRVYKIIGVDKDSKEWAADPKNRKCDVEGGWFCRGQYPPALLPYLAEGKDFAQLEDFNRKGGEDAEYQKKYIEALHKREEKKKLAEEKRQQQLKAMRNKQQQKNEL